MSYFDGDTGTLIQMDLWRVKMTVKPLVNSGLWIGAPRGTDPDLRHVIGRDGHLDQSHT